MKTIAIIPARYGSTRFPGKPLAMIDGVSMVMRVYFQVKQAECCDRVMVATDDDRIFQHVLEHGGKAMMTSETHPSGTDRVCEAALEMLGEGKLKDHVVINVQGDEPFISPDAIRLLAECFKDASVSIATLMKKISREEELFDPNVVKVIPGKGKQAMYFSRSALPWIRGRETSDWLTAFSFFKHIGIYAYRGDVLQEITKLETSPLELAEGLEQLRWLENGYKINVEKTDYESLSVDTPEDLSKIMNKA
ncbi:MAG: 3-deoxy-manno-octulosonate cytidylyltransferase [Bacteroidales bacterium]|nr:3-deoxy-manno-octulosonate cytidylyltransferase [Bacteroidales bacterium]